MILKMVVLVAALSLVSAARAADESAFADKARNRQYLGGPDESDLKVQTQILKLQKSKNETTIEEDEGF